MLNVMSIATAAGLVLPQSQLEVIQAGFDAGVSGFLLEGEPGTGKTALGRALGAAAVREGGRMIFAQAHAWASDEFLVRGIDLAGFVENDPERVYAPGLLMRAAQAGHDATGRPVVVLLDEWDKTRPVADGLLLAALEERIVVDPAGVLHGEIPANVVFWITSNATRELHGALLRRVLRQRFAPLQPAVLQDVLQTSGAGRHIAATLTAIRDDARKGGIVVTLPDLVRVARVASRLESSDACRFLLSPLLNGKDLADRRNPHGDLWAAVGRDRGAS